MILFKYTKTDGAQFHSHLDLLRHIGKTLKRAGVSVKFSQGFNPHMLVYMSAPIGVGMKSLSEYCLIETDQKAEGFKELFNEWSPKGVKCVDAWDTDQKVGVASDIKKAQYLIKGINIFDGKEFLSKSEIIIADKKGNAVNVRDKVYDVAVCDEGVRCVLAFASGLRAEKFASYLAENYGGEVEDIVKEEALLLNGEVFETILRKTK